MEKKGDHVAAISESAATNKKYSQACHGKWTPKIRFIKTDYSLSESEYLIYLHKYHVVSCCINPIETLEASLVVWTHCGPGFDDIDM